MRFNEKSTCINFLDNQLGKFLMRQASWPHERQVEFAKQLTETFNAEKNDFKKSIRYITHTFYDAYEQVKDKLKHVLTTVDLGHLQGTFIVPVSPGCTKTIFYKLYADRNAVYHLGVICFQKSKENDYAILDSAIRVESKSEEIKYYLDESYVENKIEGKLIIAELIGLLAFLKVCEIETKIIEPKQKLREINCRYFNETKSKISIIDSTWFTSIVVSPKGRRGHWRLQPYKNEQKEWDVKLIWIDPVEEIKPYTRKAKSLNQNSTDV